MTIASQNAKPLWLQLREAGARPSDLIEHFRVRTAPVPVFEIADAIGAPVFLDENMEEDGRMEFHPDAGDYFPIPVILVNKWHHENRKRFTVAHELGHLLTQSHDLKTQRRSASHGRPRLQETQANIFAANLLMPASLVYRHIRHGNRSIESLADRFMVSPEAMQIRIRSLRRLRGR